MNSPRWFRTLVAGNPDLYRAIYDWNAYPHRWAPPARLDATDLPESFVVLEAGGGTHPVDPAPACENPLADPRDGTKLTLERADNGFGDYALSTARYGLAAGELLSIDCRTGVARGH